MTIKHILSPYLWLFSLISLFLMGACRPSQEGAKTHDLTPLSLDPIIPIQETRAYQDPAYGTEIMVGTPVKDSQGRMRHEYSRRQAFNADNSLLLAQDGSGYWFLYDAKQGTLVKPLTDLAGDAEPIWHASDPHKLYFTNRGGGLVWWSLDTRDDSKTIAFDMTAQNPWPEATAYWTRGEGTTSADGRYLALLASHYDEASQKSRAYGIVLLDLQERQIVGKLDAKDFPTPNALPDHLSTAPSGQYAVVSWLADEGGTWAYPMDFSKGRQVTQGSEHSDLAVGPEGQDILVYADYQVGQIRAIDLATGQSEDLHPLYPEEGEGYAAHISGQAFEQPGWAVVSSYGDFADYGQTRPAPQLRAEYRKVWLLELKAGGRKFNLAHVRSKPEEVSADEAYFLEPQASASRDLTKVVFASNMAGPIESYVISLPEDLLD